MATMAVQRDAPPEKPAKFAVYQNPALSAALTTTSLRPSTSFFLILFSLSIASAFAFLSFSSSEDSIINKFKVKNFSEGVAYIFTKVTELIVGLAFLGASAALVKAIALRRTKITSGFVATTAANGTNVDTCLSNRQLQLLGIQTKPNKAVTEPSKKPPISKPQAPSTSSEALFPLHPAAKSSTLPSRTGSEKSSTSVPKSKSFMVSSKSQHSPSYLVSPPSSQFPSVQNSPVASTPWSSKRASPAKEILTEEELEHFLEDVDKKITESAEKLATPPLTRNGFSISSPSTISGSANTSGTTRTTPLRPVRMSQGSQKYSTPPKKGEGDLPSPMTMEESVEAFEQLGIYPLIEEWQDRLRQWFSSALLNPLLSKIGTSHMKVMQAAAKLGVSITVSPVGSDSSDAGTRTISPMDRAKEWQPAFTPDEDGLLHQLRAYLMQALDSAQRASANQQQNPQQNAFLPFIQECVDAITEHQRLLALTKGELIKGLLPQSSVPAEYTVHRIKELAEGTCVKNYEYMRNEESDKVKKKWTLELPSDSHLLLYLFCAFLEYPKWMLHVDPSSYSGAQSSKNPLFLGVLPPKERFPEKYLAVVSMFPTTLHPGACVLVVGRQSPPLFAIYWDKKLQFCLQGRTALWNSILLLCYKIKTAYGGFVRGIHLGSSALSILPVLESEEED